MNNITCPWHISLMHRKGEGTKIIAMYVHGVMDNRKKTIPAQVKQYVLCTWQDYKIATWEIVTLCNMLTKNYIKITP